MKLGGHLSLRGQSLIEVLVALAIAILVSGGIALSVVVSLSNSKFVSQQNIAAEYSQTAMELLKQVKDADFASYGTYSGNYCLGEGQITLSNTPSNVNGKPDANGCFVNVSEAYVQEVDVEKNSCDCGSNLALATPIQVDKVTVTVAWTDSKCSETGTVPSGTSTGTTCSAGLTDRINTKYCHKVVLSSCFSKIYDLGRLINTPMYTQTPTPILPSPTPISPTPMSPTPTPPDLVAYYKLDETSGDTVADVTGAHNGTAINAPIYNSGLINNGRVTSIYAGTGGPSYIDIPDSDDLTFSTSTGFSASFWVKGNNVHQGVFLTKGGYSNLEWIIDCHANDMEVLMVGNTSGVLRDGWRSICAAKLEDNFWHHVVVTWDGGLTPASIKLYIDSVFIPYDYGVNNSNLFTGIVNKPGTLRISNNSNYIDAVIDEVGLWRKPLSPAEIKDLYNCGQGNSYPFSPGQTCGTISGNVYVDNNTNGIKEPAETGYQGATVTIAGPIGYGAKTDASGNYRITVPPGTFSVNLTLSGYTITTANPVSGVIPTANVNFGVYASITSSLAAYYEMGVGGSTTQEWNDVLGANEGVVNGTTLNLNKGKIFHSRIFTSADYIDIPDKPSYTFATSTGMSAGMWVKSATANSDAAIFSKWKGKGSGVSTEWFVGCQGGLLTVMLHDKTGNADMQAQSSYSCGTSSGGLADNKWHYVLFTWSGGTTPASIKIYVDDVLLSSTGSSSGTFSSMVDTTTNVRIGNAVSSVNGWVGEIDEVGLWKKSLTQPEIDQLYNCTLGNRYPFVSFVGCGTISGNIYKDNNINGAKDAGESNFGGVQVDLTYPVPFTTTTDASGNYLFNVPTFYGAWTIAATLPTGYTATTTNPLTTIAPNTVVNFGLNGLQDSLVSFYKLDEGSSDPAVVDSIAGNNGTPTGTIGGGEGHIGSAGRAFATNDYVDIPDNDGYTPVSPTGMTIGVWVKSSTPPSGVTSIVSKYAGATPSSEWLLGCSGTSLIFLIRNTSGGLYTGLIPSECSTSRLLNGNWHYLVAVWDGTAAYSGIKMYKDNTPLTISNGGSVPSSAANSTTALRIGKAVIGFNSFVGNIDALGIWKRALSPEELTGLWNSGAGLQLP
jgi:Tfp pilus assembly protein PilV